MKVRASGRPRSARGARRRRTTRGLVVAVVTLTAGAFLVGTAGAATGSKTPAAANTPREGGSVTYGLEAETAGGFCPTTARLAISGIEEVAAIYDTLTVPNTKNQYVPYLAKSVTHDANYTHWTITLRDGIKFQDGEDLTADAVAQNINAWRGGTLLQSVFQDVSDVTVTGPDTLVVTTSTPWVDFDAFLYLDGRLGIAAPAQLNSPDCATKLIGTGPFKLDHWTLNDEMVVVKNPDYWQKDSKGQQLPYLDKITFKPVPEAAQRVNELQGKSLDIIHTSDGQQIDQLTNSLKGQFNIMEQKPGLREVRYYLMNVTKPPLDDLNARKAVAMAIDRNQINQIRNDGVFDIANGPFDKDVPGYMKNPGFPSYNPKEAKKLVAAYKASHGGQFNVVLENTNDPANSAESQLIAEQLAKVGINATLKQEDQTAFIVSAVSGNFSIMLWRNHPGDPPDVNYVWWDTGSLLNFGKFADPTMQTLLDEGRGTTDPAKIKQIYQQVNQEFAKQVFNVWGYYVNWVIASQKNVQGVSGPPLPDNGGNPEFIYGRHPLLGIWLKQ
jgi:peptide/nickel transport system substrate-binding protein